MTSRIFAKLTRPTSVPPLAHPAPRASLSSRADSITYMNPLPSQSAPFQQPSFFPPSSAAFNSSPSSWNSVPRPRLKRAHSSGNAPPVPNNSPQGPLSPALHAGSLADPSLSLGTTSGEVGIPLTRSRNGSAGLLEIIQEVPQAETLATSPVGAVAASPHARPPRTQPPPANAAATEGDRPSRSKRRRIAPDHEAFGRLSLNYSPIPSNSTSHPFFPAATSPPRSGAFPSSPLTSPTLPSFPAVPPTSPDFLPAHHASIPTSSISPPSFSPLHALSTSTGLPSLAPQLSTQPHVNAFTGHSSESIPSARAVEREVEMSPNGESSWDLDPHRIYVASLSDDEEDDSEQQRRRQAQAEEAAEQFRLNSLIASGLPTPSLLLDKRKKADGALILYQPPPSLIQPTGKGRSEETRVERIRREERERQRDEEFQEFRRESERIEADDDVRQSGANDVGDEMEMEF